MISALSYQRFQCLKKKKSVKSFLHLLFGYCTINNSNECLKFFGTFFKCNKLICRIKKNQQLFSLSIDYSIENEPYFFSNY